METKPIRNDDCGDLGNLYLAECPCRDILDLVASKWSTLIIGVLEVEPHRFGQLRRAIPGITQKTVSYTHLTLPTIYSV